MSEYKKVSTTVTRYTNGQYGAAVVGEQRSPEMMELLRKVGKSKPNLKSNESLFSDGFIIIKREKIDGNENDC